jgi:hypothetical protein
VKVALATFPRDIGEMRVELDTERKTLALAHYVPQLGGAMRCDKSFGVPAREVEAVTQALLDGKGQLVAMRMRGEEPST